MIAKIFSLGRRRRQRKAEQAEQERLAAEDRTRRLTANAEWGGWY